MKPKKQKEKYKFVFPNAMAKMMAKVDMRTQMEAGMMSQFLLVIGLTIMAILMIWTSSTRSTFSTILIVFNLCCGWLLISSYLVTTYQQYTQYMDAAGYDPRAEKEVVKKRGNIFKRISKARKAKKIKEEFRVPTLIGDAMGSKEVIDAKKEKDIKFISNAIELEGGDDYGKK